MNHFFAQIAQLEALRIPFALAVIVETKGSTPRHQAQMIVKTDGTIIGTIGGGMLERFVIKEALEAIRLGEPRLISGNLSHHGTEALHMDCGGSAKVLINVFGQSAQLVLVGGGHVNRAIAYLAHRLGFSITVLDTYAPNLAEHLFPEGTQCILGKKLKAAIDEVNFNPATYVIIATNHEDRVALATLANQSIRYLGIMASHHKSQILLNMLLQNGVPETVVHHIHSPVGLDIGAETPEEIAISVMAEILSVKNQTSALPLYRMTALQKERLVVIRGAGEMGTGVAVRLHKAGFRIAMLDVAEPTSIRNTVAFSEAIRLGSMTVEGIQANKANNRSEVDTILKQNCIAVLVDPSGNHIQSLSPTYVIDAILAKKNLGTEINMAPIVIALGSGFTAGQDCRAVIETNRGHNLGKVIYEGCAEDNTGEPGSIMGYAHERLVRAPIDGRFIAKARIGDLVKKTQIIAYIDKTPVLAPIDGMLRGLIHSGAAVHQAMKIGDVDPRGSKIDPMTISDKARAIAGSVLEAMLYLAKF
ncbi:MAG: EF2563 family selenium-dependent molybdenum hydroxylase system protein [Neisseriales bacterium]|nr:MAG: EF2563 family selenium-dependent molybdenum hydroxylase system protein [Neisseriales bacterium]